MAAAVLASRRGAVHRLEEEVVEAEALEPLGLGAGLGVDQLELVARW